MSRRYIAVGIFIVAGVTLFALGIFLVGSRHEAFARHMLLYTELADLDGIDKVGRVHLAEALSYRALTDEVRRAA